MRIGPKAAAVTALLLVWAGCMGPEQDGPDPLDGASGDAGPGAQSTDQAPGLRVGDHWVQRAYYEAHADETIRVIEYHVEAREVLDLPSGEVAAVRISNNDGNKTLWLRTMDWAVVQTAVHNETTVLDPACAAHAWPMDLGQSWSHDCRRVGADVHGVAQEILGQELHSRVVAESRVSVPAGDFDVIELKTTVASGSSEYEIEEHFAPDACFPARTVIHGGDGPIVVDLIAFECGG